MPWPTSSDGNCQNSAFLLMEPSALLEVSLLLLNSSRSSQNKSHHTPQVH